MSTLGKTRLNQTVGTSSYNDLSDKPTLGTASAEDVSAFAPALGANDNYVTDTEKSNLHAPGSDNQDLSALALKSNVLELDNTDAFTPDADYEPATKKYVDDNAGGHTQNTDTGLGGLGTKNPPIDADKAIYRDSTASDALVTSTWTQIKAFLKTYFDGIYLPLTGGTLTGNLIVPIYRTNTALEITTSGVEWEGQSLVLLDATSEEASVNIGDGATYSGATICIKAINIDNGTKINGTFSGDPYVFASVGEALILKQYNNSWYIVGEYTP